MQHIINLSDEEYALIGAYHSVESFMVIENLGNSVSVMMLDYDALWEDRDAFSSFSGPVVNHNDYLSSRATTCIDINQWRS